VNLFRKLRFKNIEQNIDMHVNIESLQLINFIKWMTLTLKCQSCKSELQLCKNEWQLSTKLV